MSRWAWMVSGVLLAAAVAAVLLSGNGVLSAARAISPAALALVFLALFLNAVMATVRFKVIAADVGHSLRFRDALAAVSTGAVAGALFFQVAGQLIARSALMGRGGVPLSSVVVMTAYERAMAAAVSALMAAAGAYYLFGQVSVDAAGGGGEFVRILVGLLAAALCGAIFGFGRQALRVLAQFPVHEVAGRLVRSAALTVLVQVPMLAAYLAAARGLSPETPLADLTAACAIVMFAAAVPVSLGGWGVREMSAVIALGTIGIGAGKAFLAALIIGGGSLMVMAALAVLSMRGVTSSPRALRVEMPVIDWGVALQWTIPCAVAVLILFQLFVPVGETRINVNLADPLAILGGVLFVVAAAAHREILAWRLQGAYAVLAACTLVLAYALLIGAVEFGWTTWAVTNRFIGWFVLLAFAATGATLVKAGGEEGLRLLLMTFAGATVAVIGIDAVIVALRAGGVDLPVRYSEGLIEGFAGNRNGLAFQVLMAKAAVLAAKPAPRVKMGLLALLLAGLFLSGSRAALGTAPFVVALALYLRLLAPREAIVALMGAAAIVAATAAPALLPSFSGSGGQATALELAMSMQRDPSANERGVSFVEGFRMFADNPVFGAGLGAFIRQNLGLGGAPLVIHSSPLWLLAETGMVGFLVFVGPAVALLFVEFRRVERDAAANLIVLCLVAFAVMSQVHDLIYQRSLWLFLGAALALPAARRSS